jgi:hypothetical protein
MGNLAELLFYGGVYFRMTMAVEVCPDGGIGVDVFVAARIAEDCALSVNYNDRLARKPVPHLRKRMPDVFLI